MTDAPDAPAGSDERVAGPARAVFIGSGKFGLPILDAVRAAPEVELVGVISAPDRPAGRHGELRAVPIAARARELGLTLLQPARIRRSEAIAEVAALRPFVGILADYGQLIPPELVELPDRGIVNVHPSFLPRHRGASPIPATILAGDRETGVTLIRMDAWLDTGPVIGATRWPLTGHETAPDLEAHAAAVGAELLSRTIGRWLRGEVSATPQADDGVTLTRPLRRDDGRLDAGRPAAYLERQIRALQPWPGSFAETMAGRLIVWGASVGDIVGASSTAGVIGPGPDLRIATGDRWLVLDEVQPAGGRRMSGADWLLGRPAAVGSMLVEPSG